MKHLLNILLLSVIIISCNPVKRVLNNSKKFEIVAKEVVKRGYCVNDTVIIDSSRIDTVYNQHYIIDTVTINKEYNIDTVLKSGAKVTIVNGVLSVKCPSSKDIIKTVTKNNYIRDLKLESILKEENYKKSDSLKLLSLKIKENNITIRNLKIDVIKQKVKFVVMLIILGLIIILYVYSKFRLL